MKLFKTVLIMMLFFVTLTSFAQEVVEEATASALDWFTIKAFFLPTLTGSMLALLADAKKWMFTKEWDFGIFFSTKIKPFLLTTALMVALYVLISLAPFMKPFVEVLSGTDLGIMSAGTLGIAAAAIIDGFMKKAPTT